MKLIYAVIARLTTSLVHMQCELQWLFVCLVMIVVLALAAQSSPDVTGVSEVDSAPLGMYVAT